MDAIVYGWSDGGRDYELRLVHVHGTKGHPYRFGNGAESKDLEVPNLFVATIPATQALWDHVMGPGTNPSLHRGPELPLENVSWDDVTGSGGFLDGLNQSAISRQFRAKADGRFRLPTEAEWEYAARGGPHWTDGFRFSGSDDVEAVAWYDRRHGDHTQAVAQKAANQLGIFDMSGNVWEWCQDVYTPDVSRVPRDGSAYEGSGDERVLRGGCFHNWAIHCTVWKRYAIGQPFHDGCIGVRLVFG